MGIYKRLFLFFLSFFFIFPLACDNKVEVFYYLYFDMTSLTLYEDEQINFLDLDFDTNIDSKDIVIYSDSNILHFDNLIILPINSGNCTLYVTRSGSREIVSSIEVNVLSKTPISQHTDEVDENNQGANNNFSFTHSSFSQGEDVFYTISIFKDNAEFSNFDYICSNPSVNISKIMNVLQVLCKEQDAFTIRIIDRTSNTFFEIVFPIN